MSNHDCEHDQEEKYREDRHETLFNIRRSVRYHEYRQQFYASLHNVLMVLVIIMLILTMALNQIGLVLAAIFLLVMDFVADTHQKEWRHQSFSTGFHRPGTENGVGRWPRSAQISEEQNT